jgi:hypothetical protein
VVIPSSSWGTNFGTLDFDVEPQTISRSRIDAELEQGVRYLAGYPRLTEIQPQAIRVVQRCLPRQMLISDFASSVGYVLDLARTYYGLMIYHEDNRPLGGLGGIATTWQARGRINQREVVLSPEDVSTIRERDTQAHLIRCNRELLAIIRGESND